MVKIGDAVRFVRVGPREEDYDHGPFDCVVQDIKRGNYSHARSEVWGLYWTPQYGWSEAPGYMWLDGDEHWRLIPHPNPERFKGEYVKHIIAKEAGCVQKG